jgi:hypothetical protein
MRIEPVVRCTMPECGEPAVYKVAAPWRDEHHQGLKTYEFACADHLLPLFRDAEGRWLEYEPQPEETVEELGVFRFEPLKGDRNLEREHQLESALRS